MGFADFMLGSRPDMQLTDEQKGVYDAAMGYGHQYGPGYKRNLKQMRRYNQGTMRTDFMTPVLTQMDADQADAMATYRARNAPGFNQGGAELAAATEASLGGKYARDKGIVAGGMYHAQGQALADRANSQFESGEGRYLNSLGLAGNMANSAFDNRRQGGFLGDLLKGGLNAGLAFATGGTSALKDMATGGGFF